MAELLQDVRRTCEFEVFYSIRNLCRLCGNTTNPNQRFSIVSECWKCVKLQVISETETHVKSDGCLPQYLIRNCCRTLFNLQKFKGQGRCISSYTTQVNLSKGKEELTLPKIKATQQLSRPLTVVVLNFYQTF